MRFVNQRLPTDIHYAEELLPNSLKPGSRMDLLNWVRERYPYAFTQLQRSRPDLIELASNENPAALSDGVGPQFAGLGADDEIVTEGPPATDWGKSVSDILGVAIQGYQANKLMNLNIKLAEQGKAPIDNASLLPGFAIGATKDVQRIALLGLGAVTVLGLAMVWKRRS